MTEPVRETQKKYSSRAMVFAIAGCLVFILMGQKAIGKGLILGTLFSVVNFVLIGEGLPLAIGKSQKRNYLVPFGLIFFRYALLAIPVILAISLSQIDLISTVVGLFMIQLMILIEHFHRYLTHPDH